ncbi:sarcosine oxidase [Pseudomonas gessardii]|uniref:N-methyl-L-tryptophan oxidase n=1 Tax=Pseudomonas gessardii TaxID=78544 RepID=A0A7Y1QN07_9PSED|nr:MULTISPECIES: N-methyl-L-tryptophan oxidase [Pseudomonas]NNA97067.1 N-methyl-L-tryptophan oxidase [Pseudomonas gessardii]SDQ40050.1 sarcosine oxidase [Pseudomonas gessardii]
MKNYYDVIVVGLGIFGASALWRLASKGKRVLGVDAGGPTHCFGSSHGSSRIFRRAYWEGEKYLPLLNHADTLWNELEAVAQRKLLFRTGGIFIGHSDSRVVKGSTRTAKLSQIKHSLLTADKVCRHVPAFNIPHNFEALYEPGAYAISACDARLTMLNEAVHQGVVTLFGESVVSVKNNGAGATLKTKNGNSYTAKSVIVTTGPWIAEQLLPELKDYLETRKLPVYWFTPKTGSENIFSPENFPVFLYESSHGHLLYGVPSIVSNEPGVKIGFHNRQQIPTHPSWMEVQISQQSIEEISTIVSPLLPDLERLPARAKNCFYTMSKDESFLIGASTKLNSVYFASACSGHGFKFATAIGDALAHLVNGQDPSVSISEFSPTRFWN